LRLGAAKAGLYGFMRVLSIEGRKYGIRLWGLAPGAYTRMTSDLPGRKDREPDHRSHRKFPLLTVLPPLERRLEMRR
jgi:NAD(P)-dependent dehydrogenase (short-subunit alcohol dehydrogenase family)